MRVIGRFGERSDSSVEMDGYEGDWEELRYAEWCVGMLGVGG